MSHEGSDTIALTSTVGDAAHFTVEESDRGGLRSRRYRDFAHGAFARPD
ncbi:hypothetical protein MCBMB27_00746 [Methylobacterium phyllosphaerae]|uniref:Uncharacterized protein n=1 Tax=Methylobacterium phyllosphaerae TaxID=418223 RepID=A0AAE8L851_9HYPH|nr:hypothetical protein [Methylobacterium phyllosphaerae]APT30037.1 hypothetical protein MCBMB27_00746 [Methylobacterium phyllosphaerae]SFH32228.1 hypothetical protein SAMN05192567_12042 [Methylobacterium phyllosphaerae]